MGSTLYFAYGSNMMVNRLRQRCQSARFRTIGRANQFDLSFSKKSKDGSGKATIVHSRSPSSCVYGVLFDINLDELNALDRIEGRGEGYDRVDNFNVLTEPDYTSVSGIAYIADQRFVDFTLQPYDWYLQLVIRGAQENHLPKLYIDSLRAVPFNADPDLNRQSRIEALELFAQTGNTV